MLSDKEYRTAFEKMLQENPLDSHTRLVYADWLEEHGLDDESAEQRRRSTPEWKAAYGWMVDFASRCGFHSPGYSEGAAEIWGTINRLRDQGVEGGALREHPDYLAASKRREEFEGMRPVSYDDCIEAGHGYLSHGDYFVQLGDEGARESMYSGGGKEFWRNWSTLTGVALPDDIARGDHGSAPFSCSC